MNDVPEFYAKDRAAWRQWLIENHATQKSVWLVFDKGKNRTMSWEDIVQESLCFGCIDSTAGKVSDTRSKIYVSRRKPTSAWSKINKAHIEHLTTGNHIMSAGQAAIDLAKQNGSWDALNKSDNLEQPPELIASFAKNKRAADHFSKFPDSAKRVILAWIYSAKRDETRLKRIQETVTLAEQNIRAHQ